MGVFQWWTSNHFVCTLRTKRGNLIAICMYVGGTTVCPCSQNIVSQKINFSLVHTRLVGYSSCVLVVGPGLRLAPLTSCVDGPNGTLKFVHHLPYPIWNLFIVFLFSVFLNRMGPFLMSSGKVRPSLATTTHPETPGLSWCHQSLVLPLYFPSNL